LLALEPDMTTLPFWRTILDSYRAAFATIRRIPVALAIAALFLASEDVAQQALGLTAVNPAEAATNPILAALFLWKDLGMWLVSLLVVRSIIADRRGAALWRIDGLALAAFALAEAMLILDHTSAALIGDKAASLGGLDRWMITVVKFATIFGLNIVRLRLTQLLEPAWRLGDRTVGPFGSWRATRGSTWRIFFGGLVVTLPILVLHYMLSYRLQGGGTDPLRLAGIGLDGVLEAAIVLVESAFSAVVYRRLHPFIAVASDPRPMPASPAAAA
jgi:hypothetical protein